MAQWTPTNYGASPSSLRIGQSIESERIDSGDNAERDVVNSSEGEKTDSTPGKMVKVMTFLKSLKGITKSSSSLQRGDSTPDAIPDASTVLQRRSLTHADTQVPTSLKGQKCAAVAKKAKSQVILSGQGNGSSSSSSSSSLSASSSLRSSLSTQPSLLRESLSKCLRPIQAKFPTIAFHSIQLENIISTRQLDKTIKAGEMDLNSISLNLHEGSQEVTVGLVFEDPNDSYNDIPLKHGVVEEVFANLQTNFQKHVPDSNIGAAFANTYPRNVALSQINCDAFCAYAKEKYTLSVVADGCGWGGKSRKAAQRAVAGVISYLDQVLADNNNPIKTAQELAQHLISSLANAHAAIYAPEYASDQCGTTTINICMKFEDAKGVSYLMDVGVGDCKALIVTLDKDGNFETTEVLPHRRLKMTATDPGGRLGPYGFSGFNPDLRNLSLVCIPLPTTKRSWIFNMSDGLHDQFNPIELGIQPSELNGNLEKSITWSDVDLEVRHSMMNQFQNKLFEDKVKEALARNPSSDSICKYLIEYAYQVTGPLRTFMETSTSFEPEDKREYPGKTDHTSVVVFSVGNDVA